MAGRYATALFELALEERALDAVQADLERFDALINESADLRRLVRSPVFTAEEQTKALAAVLEAAGIGGLAGRFLQVVASNRRLFAVRDMIKAFRKLLARHRGEVTAEVTFAEPPHEQHLEAIGLIEYVEFHVGEAVSVLRETGGTFDLIFNDIDKHGYPASLPVIRDHLRPGGLMIVDNLLWHGGVLDPEDDSDNTKGVRELTRLVMTDPAWTASIVPLRDGMMIARKS